MNGDIMGTIRRGCWTSRTLNSGSSIALFPYNPSWPPMSSTCTWAKTRVPGYGAHMCPQEARQLGNMGFRPKGILRCGPPLNTKGLDLKSRQQLTSVRARQESCTTPCGRPMLLSFSGESNAKTTSSTIIGSLAVTLVLVVTHIVILK